MMQEHLNLLVSVRDVDEALLALQAGARILDIKEPLHGSLGMADPQTLADIVAASRRRSAAIPLSAALGELRDWPEDATPVLPKGLTFAKLGLSGQRSMEWVVPWVRLRHRVEQSIRTDLNWIAVVYADSAASGSPPADEIIDAAIESGCRGVLFDTWSKSSGNLLTHLPVPELEVYIERIHAAGLLIAVAGGLDMAAIGQLHGLPVDIVAVRGAACTRSERTAALCPDRIRQLRECLGDMSRQVVRTFVLQGER